MSCQFDYYYNIDRKPDKLLIGNSVYYLTKINKTACDLQTAQMVNMLFPIRWTVVFPHMGDHCTHSNEKLSMAKL